jgi:hypothetical protein
VWFEIPHFIDDEGQLLIDEDNCPFRIEINELFTTSSILDFVCDYLFGTKVTEYDFISYGAIDAKVFTEQQIDMIDWLIKNPWKDPC